MTFNNVIIVFITVSAIISVMGDTACGNECACNRMYWPVCAINSNGNYKLFGNICTLRCQQCENPSDGRFITTTN